MHILSEKIWFPPIELTSPEGIIAIGGDLSVERLLLAYKSGIFPWYNEGEPIVWHCPEQRMVLFPEKLKISKSMRQLIRKKRFKVTFNTRFDEVLANCKTIYRKDQGGTWITSEMQQAYCKLHELGFAKSVEVWSNNELIGGLYGIDLPAGKADLGTVFCGESMFSKVPNASKIGFIYLVEKLKAAHYKILDCQLYTDHLASLGAEEITRTEFLKYL